MDRDGDLTMEDGHLEGFWELRDGAVCGRVMDDWGRDGAELCGIPYWVRESEMHSELFHKEVPSEEPGLCVAEIFLL